MGAHRYWRIYIDQPTTSWLIINEIELRSSPGGADETGTGTASASSVYSTHTAASAVDNNNSTYWQSSANAPGWWEYDFGAGVTKDIVEVSITGGGVGAPSRFRLQYSDDNSTWNTLFERAHTWSASETVVFTKAAPAASRYWRIYINKPTNSWLEMKEVELRATIGGADETGSGTASASSSYLTNTPAKAVDNDTATRWLSSANGPGWWEYDFGAGVTKNIVQVSITDGGVGAPSDIDFQFSSDNTNWDTAWSSVHTWSASETVTFPVSPRQILFWEMAQAEYTDPNRLKLEWLFAQAEYSETQARLAIQDLTFAPSEDNLTLAAKAFLAINDLTFAPSLDGDLSLLGHILLAIQDLTFAMAMDDPVLAAKAILAIQDLTFGMTEDQLTLIAHAAGLGNTGRFFLLF